MEEEFNLSEEIYNDDIQGIILVEDVKEFILKEDKLLNLLMKEKITLSTFLSKRLDLIGEKFI